MSPRQSLTTRRSFIAASGFGGVSLYALWAGYGAAPGPLALLGLTGHPHEGAGGGGHGGHTDAEGGGRADEFRRLTAEFVERYRMSDGSVYPRRLASEPMPAMDHSAHAMPAAAAADQGAHAHDGGQTPSVAAPAADAHGHAAAAAGHGEADAHAEGGALDVYMLAEKWAYEPSALRLDAGVPYRFRMMASDVSHGASIQFGRGSRMIRLRPNTVTEIEATFDKPGRYLVYCTVYCGQAHDVMQARIEVV